MLNRIVIQKIAIVFVAMFSIKNNKKGVKYV